MSKKSFLSGYQTYDTSEGFGSPKDWRKAFNQRFSQQEAADILSDQPQTPHQILGVTPGATAAEIKKAFRMLINEWHPDRNPHRHQVAEAQSRRIIAAYSLLST